MTTARNRTVNRRLGFEAAPKNNVHWFFVYLRNSIFSVCLFMYRSRIINLCVAYSYIEADISVCPQSLNIYFIVFYFTVFYFILFYFILFYFILFYFILFYFILFYSFPFYSIVLHSILFYSILFYSILSYSILLYSIFKCVSCNIFFLNVS